MDSKSCLIHSVDATAAEVDGLTTAAELLHGEKTVPYADTEYQEIEKQPFMQGRGIGFHLAVRLGKPRALPDTPERRVNGLIQTTKANLRVQGEHPFSMIKRQFGF